MFEKYKEISYLLDKTDKKKIILLISGISLVGLFEIAMLAMVFPFLTIAVQPGLLEKSQGLQILSKFISIDDSQLIIVLGLIVLILLISGNIFSAMVSWYSLKESNKFGDKISVKLFRNYLNKPHEFYFKNHSSELAKNVLIEANRIIMGILSPSLQVISRIISSFCIVCFLFYVNPLVAITMTTGFILTYFLLLKKIKINLFKKGKEVSKYSALRHKAIVEALSVIKHIQILGRQSYFLNQFEKSNERYFNLETDIYFVPYLSRYLIETIAFSIIFLVVIFMTAFGDGVARALPMLGIYVLAVYRLLPAAQQIFNGISQVHSHWEAVNIIRNDFLSSVKKEARDFEKIKFTNSIKLTVNNFCYEKGFDVLKKIDINIEKNTMVAFVGATGSGKTTTIDLILKMLVSKNAKLMIDDVEINESNTETWQNNVGYVSQEIYLLDDSIWANIAFGVPKDNIAKELVMEAAKMADIHEYIIGDLEGGYDTVLGENGIRLSGGQKQRIGIARALYTQPQVLVLDEATSALDSITESRIMESVKFLSEELTIILIAHRLSTVELCHKIFVFEQGEILAEGCYEDLVKTCEQFRRLAKVA